MAASTQACDVKILLANSEPSTHGPSPHSLLPQPRRFRSKADINCGASRYRVSEYAAQLSRLPARRFDGSDVDLRCQRAMDGALVGDLEEARTLFVIKAPSKVITRSMWSIIPSFVSHSAQSAA